MNAQFRLSTRTARIFALISIGFGVATLFLPMLELQSPAYTKTGGFILALMYICVLPACSFLAVRYKPMIHVNVAILNLITSVAFVYYVGTYSPFALLWVAIIVISYLYSGLAASVISSAVLMTQTIVILFAYGDSHATTDGSRMAYYILSLIVSLSAIAVSYIIVAMINRAHDRAMRLYASQQAEGVQLNRLNTLLNSISDTVLTLNRYGRITSQNSAALSFFDTNQSLVGKSIDAVLSIKDDTMQPISVRKLAADIKSTVIRDDISLADTSNGIMRLNIQLSPIRGKFGDDDSGCVVIIRDITRQKTLEDEKDEFISVTSHELRTPIAIAEGSLSNLLYMFEKDVESDKLVSAAVAAHDQVLYLARMINDLSTLSRAERGVGDEAEEIDMNTLLQELYLRYQPEAENKSLSLNLDLDTLPNATVSRLYLEEILQNFLTNAIKYTTEGSVTLSGKVRSGKIVCSVSDSGIGISKTDQDKIFDKFFRSEDYRTRETSGTGLGLYVVRKLADKLNTKIEVESRLNHGSTFSFSLPVSSKHELSAEKAS